MMHHRHPLAGLERLAASVSIRPIDDCARFNLRISPQDLAAASTVWGADLPPTIGGLVSSNGRLAACLGPDEWLLLAPSEDHDAIERGFARLYATTLHSLVDISHREVGIAVDGPAAAIALQSCIAFDVLAMPAGSACRTIIDRVQIILLREAPDRFRVEVWPSFADHVWHLLVTICHEIELGA